MSERTRAIEPPAVALAALHDLGRTDGDAMAENVMIDLDAGVARGFDLETVHDTGRTADWRRVDDVRALLARCALRAPPGQLGSAVRMVVDARADDRVRRLLTAHVATVLRRRLTFHLGHAALSLPDYREITRLLQERSSE